MLLEILIQVLHAFILIGMVIFLTIPNQGKRDFMELGLIIFLSLVTETIGEIGWWVFNKQMNVSTNIYNILVFPIIVLLFRRKINWKNKNAIAYSIIVLFLIYGLVNFFFIQKPQGLNSYTRTLSAVGTIIICITYFYILIKELPTQSITKLPMFWITSAFLIYRSGTFFLYLSADYLINVIGNDLIEIWSIHHIFGLFFYSMLFYAMLLIRAQYMKLRPAAANG